MTIVYNKSGNRKMITAKRIKEIRKHFGLSMQDFADKVLMTQSSISCYEAGKRMPSIDTCYKIITFAKLNGLDIDLEWLRPPH